jgi:hypothetical protein
MAVMVALLVASLYVYLVKRPEWKRANSVWYRAANRWGQVGLWISGIGLLFLLFRAISLDFFNLRFWLYLWALVTVVAAVWFVYWYRTKYPAEMARYMKAQRARQYMPGAGRSVARQQAKGGKAQTVTGGVAGAAQPAQPAQPTRQAPAGAHRGGKKRKKK